MSKSHLILAGISGALAVVFGAFGAHGLKSLIDPASLEVWKTGVSYHFYHTICLLVLAFLSVNNKYINWAFNCFVIGIFLFSGSLYILSTKSITGINWPLLGPVTPIGGLFFIAGWINLMIAGLKQK